MQIKIFTTTDELEEAGLTLDQLKQSIIEALTEQACGPDGERIDLPGFVIEAETIPSPAEFQRAIQQ